MAESKSYKDQAWLEWSTWARPSEQVRKESEEGFWKTLKVR